MVAVGAALLVWLLPGLGLAVFVHGLRNPEGEATPGLFAQVMAASLATWLLTAGLLAETVGLTYELAWVSTLVLDVWAVALLLLPSSRRVLRRCWRELGWGLGVLLLGAAVWLPVGLVVFQTWWAPLGGTSWYYWDLAVQTARAGSLPATSVEFGTTVPFLRDYPFFTSGTAFLVQQVPEAQAHVVREVVTTIAALYAAAGSAVLARAFGAGRLASLVAVPLGIGTGLAAFKLTAYRPEGFAIGLVLLAVALVVDGLERRDPRSVGWGVVTTALLAQVHGIALVGTAVFLVAACVALVLRERSWRFVGQVALTGVAVAAATGLLALATGGLSGAVHEGGIANVSGSDDPTWEFVQAAKGRPPSTPPDQLELLRSGLRAMYEQATWWALGAAGVSLVVLLLTRSVRQRFGAMVVFVLLSLVLLAIPVAVLLLGWDSYVPRRTGTLRVAHDASLLLPPLVACAVAALASLVPRPRWGHVVSALAVVAATSIGLQGVWLEREQRVASRIGLAEVQALESLDLPPGSVVLTDGYSEGVVHATTGAVGLLEGRAPYTFPDLLERANGLLRGAEEFYRRPREQRDFLQENDVDYVLVTSRRRALGGAYRFPVAYAEDKLVNMRDFVRIGGSDDVAVFHYLGQETDVTSETDENS